MSRMLEIKDLVGGYGKVQILKRCSAATAPASRRF